MMARLLILTLAVYSCTATLTTDLVVPENLDFTAFSKLAPTDFLQAVIQSGGTEADCRAFATTTIATISESVKSQGNILNAVDTGAGCAAEGQQLVQVAQGKLQGKQGALATKEGLAKTALEAKTAACTAGVEFSVGLDTLKKASCYDYTTEASYTQVKATCTGATTASNQAAAAVASAQISVKDAQGEVDTAVAEAARLKSACLCRVKKEHAAAQVAVQAATATNAADWKQAHEVLCALAQTTSCQFDACPVVTPPTLSSDVKSANCQIAQGIVANCNLDQLTGKIYYASQTSIHDSSHTHCYHVEVGTVIEQEASQSTIGHQCSAETFEKQYRVGSFDTEMSETKQHYSEGSISDGCKNNGNPDGKRTGTLVVKQDPNIKESYAEVDESSVCVYDVTLHVPAC